MFRPRRPHKTRACDTRERERESDFGSLGTYSDRSNHVQYKTINFNPQFMYKGHWPMKNSAVAAGPGPDVNRRSLQQRRIYTKYKKKSYTTSITRVSRSIHQLLLHAHTKSHQSHV